MKNRYKYLVLFIFLFALFVSIKLIDGNFFLSSQPNTYFSNNSFSSASTITENGENDILVVEISGGVYNPGIYKLQNGSRIGDLINLAGGVDNNKADLGLISETINQAQKLKDQQKVYIPIIKINVNPNHSENNLISINYGSLNDLVSLNGIGEVSANKIIANRFYSSLEELVSKKIISSSVFENIKDKLRL